MKINAVCGNGLGSSLILKINIDNILQELGVNATVETTDVASVKSSDADLIVTTKQFEKNLEDSSIDIIYLNNVTETDVLKEELKKFLNK